ncbi:unnamed protein product [Ostreobium quekettii]|uniref:DNA topoisomerase I n=1 Tax=Ostreobium quekettii TaxID=121088 RepID=A0A8S1ILR7_9CHLO|nr:unnamed protein product [Ostreobium quekettii]|eukprot:evm.model.scf_253EXC.6 EVM.evm.TU.scf_253EXC.6   scf_253EXC:40790-45159(-)
MDAEYADEKPPASRLADGSNGQNGYDSDDSDDVPLALRATRKSAQPSFGAQMRSNAATQSSDSDDVPLGLRAAQQTKAKKAKQIPRRNPVGSARAPSVGIKRKSSRQESAPRPRSRARMSSQSEGKKGGDGSKYKWETLEWNGVLFPPEYEPHGVKMLYDGVPVDLTPQAEEVATFFAVMLDTDYVKKPTFIKNFWDGFRRVLGPKHPIKEFKKCDFGPIHQWHLARKEDKKAMSKEEKARLKEKKNEDEAKYKFAYVDGRKEQVGNFRIEPPGLFRGRGEHPKMGCLKRRIYPRDITINIGKGVPVPDHPYPGQSWKEVRTDQTVTWLAYWKDPVNVRDFKYVWLSANSHFRMDSDEAKYEKARLLKDKVGAIRAQYRADWMSKKWATRQMATALYFIDKLALRAGHEKDDDEADTVGCCNLKVENVECINPNKIKFDFLGKDSIRYENVVEVEPAVYENVKRFCRADENGAPKSPAAQLFDSFDAVALNAHLKQLMPGLSVKVFRTYNASITLDDLLCTPDDAGDKSFKSVLELPLPERKAAYHSANKQVAVLCNHQKAAAKGFDDQMKKLQLQIEGLNKDLEELQAELDEAKDSGDVKKVDRLKKRVEAKETAIRNKDVQARTKEENKNVALGTSKINYMDPRITVAWCKRNEVPIEAVFTKALMHKFSWAMESTMWYRF